VDEQWLLFLMAAIALAALALAVWSASRQRTEIVRSSVFLSPRRGVTDVREAPERETAEAPPDSLQEIVPSGDLRDLTHLAAHVERMRARLESSRADRRLWDEAVEEIVEERTSELVALYEKLRHKEDMIKRLLGKVLTAQEQERVRLARELHDEIGQSLTAIIMTTTVVESSLPPEMASSKEKLVNVRTMATQALHGLRGLIFDLRPEVLDDLGLALALRSQIKKHLEPLGVEVQLRASGLRDHLPHEVETAVFRVVQEAITNIARHAGASQASVSLTREHGRLVVRVRDNGKGFDTGQVLNGPRQAWGLFGMQERVTLLGGKFYISTRPGAGTLLLAEIPLDGEWACAPKGLRGEQDPRLDR
jgi:signal transduction histidine kinase